MQNKILVVMCGCPGSGKSTYLDKVGSRPIVVSRDKIRFEYINKYAGDYFAYESKVFNDFVDEIKNALASKDEVTVFADATHLSPGSRRKLLRALGDSLFGVWVEAFAFDVTLEYCLENNRKREGIKFVPEDQLKNMYKGFSYPTIEEGFNEIIIFNPVKGTYKIKEESDI